MKQGISSIWLWPATAARAKPLWQKPCCIWPGLPTDRGKIGEGNTVCDYDPEEIRRKSSVSAAVAPFEWRNHKINLLDAPGLFDFEAGLCEAVRAADTVLIAVSGKSGVAVGTEKAFAAAENAVWQKSSLSTVLCGRKRTVLSCI